jgi:hypothetical protein
VKLKHFFRFASTPVAFRAEDAKRVFPALPLALNALCLSALRVRKGHNPALHEREAFGTPQSFADFFCAELHAFSTWQCSL